MKIINEQDYYDGAGYGVDPSIVYLRKRRDVETDTILIPAPFFKSLRDREDDRIEFFAVLFAGDLHPAAAVITPDNFDNPRRYIYDSDEVFSLMKAWEKSAPGNTRFFLPRDNGITLQEFFARTGEGPWTKWAVDEKITTAVFRRGDHDARTGFPKAPPPSIGVADNGDLRSVSFYRAVDPHTAHMRISSWVGGVLPSSPETVEISDTSKILKAGFDTKSSFRKPKQKRK